MLENKESLDTAVEHFREVYKERQPYQIINTLNGKCYRWTDIFIQNCVQAMSTDAMTQFTEDERDAWNNFVNFENRHSNQADSSIRRNAIGCTIPDEEGNSYIVYGKTNKKSDKLCNEPMNDVVNSSAWASLDKAFMSLYRCEEIDDCDREKELDRPCNCSEQQ